MSNKDYVHTVPTMDDVLSHLSTNMRRKAEIGTLLCKGGVPTDPREVRLYLDVARDEEDTLLRLGKLLQDDKKNVSDDNFKMAMLESLRIKKSTIPLDMPKGELSEDMVSDVELMVHELNRAPETLDVDDFIKDD